MNFHLLIILSIFAISVPKTYAHSIIKILAVVENTPITSIDLVNFKQILIARKKTLGISTKNKPIEELIEENILEKYTKEKKWYPNEKEIDTFIQQRIKAQHLTQKSFKAYIKQNGYTYDSFRTDLKLQKAKANLVEKELKNRITITEEEIEKEFAKFTSEPIKTTSYTLKLKTENAKCENANKDFDNIESMKFLDTELQSSIKTLVKSAFTGEIKSVYQNNECTIIKVINKTNTENPQYTKLKPQITKKLILKKIEKEFKNWITEKKEEYFVKVFK